MSILIVKNIATEGPGTLGEYLEKRGLAVKVSELWDGRRTPSLAGATGLVVLGGPMGVYEMDKFPHLKKAVRLIEKSVSMGIPVFGVCLGAQLMAHALGARVYKGHKQEVGWDDIEITESGLKDKRMRLLAQDPDTGKAERRVRVFQWHGDTFDMPKGAKRLASSKQYENQAFVYGGNAYAFQFHIEANRAIIKEWFQDRPNLLKPMMKECGDVLDGYTRRAEAFYEGLFGLGRG